MPLQLPDGYEIDDQPARVDLEVVWSFLSTEAYWGRWRSRQDVTQQVTGAWRVVGAYRGADRSMVGFARAVSDGVALAYLADVFVLPTHRGQGLGSQLIAVMIDDGPGAESRWLLHTADAQHLYGRFGFAPQCQSLLERPGARPAIASAPTPESQ